MDKIRKFELMEKIVHELEDLKNSNQALIQKIAKIEVDNIDLGNKRRLVHRGESVGRSTVQRIGDKLRNARDSQTRACGIPRGPAPC